MSNMERDTMPIDIRMRLLMEIRMMTKKFKKNVMSMIQSLKIMDLDIQDQKLTALN